MITQLLKKTIIALTGLTLFLLVFAPAAFAAQTENDSGSGTDVCVLNEFPPKAKAGACSDEDKANGWQAGCIPPGGGPGDLKIGACKDQSKPAGTGGKDCKLSQKTFFFLPPWWEYLSGEEDPLNECAPAFDFPNDIWAVALAIIDMLLRLAGFIAVLSIIFSGVMYITAMGNMEKAMAARRRIYNSLIGLSIVLVATTFVTFIGKTFT